MSETGDNLSVELAKALGWRVEQRPISTIGATFDAYRAMGCVEYVLVCPDGTVREWHDEEDDPGEMTDGFINMPEHAGLIVDMWQHAPDFAGSVDATLATLPEHIAVDFRATRDGFPLGYYRVSLIDWTIHDGRQWKWDADGATRAEALARARLAMAKAQQERPDAT